MAATPSGRVPPSGFGMFTRRDGLARYAPECTRSCRSASRPSSPSSYIRHVVPSTPAAAPFFNAKNAQRSASTVMWWRSVVRRTRGSRCTNCRIRSAACVTLSRSCVRNVLWLPGFPLGSTLGSTGSAGADAPLFVGFTATMAESDFSMPFIFGYGFLLAFAIPPRQRDGMETSRSRCSAYVRAWVLRHRGTPTPLAKSVGRMLPSVDYKTSASGHNLFRCSIALPARAPVNA